MKKIIALITACTLAVAITGTALARTGNGGQPGGGCGNCSQAAVPTDLFTKFQQDTIDLRQEMMNKRYEMQRENLKGTPDTARIALLQADVTALQTKIHDIRAQSGLPYNDKRDGECSSAAGICDKNLNGNCNKRQMGGCNNQPCFTK